MYKQLKNDFLVELDKVDIDADVMKLVIQCLNVAAKDYDISRKETAIVVYEHDKLPTLAKTYLVSLAVEGYSEQTLYNYTKNLENFFKSVQMAPESVKTNDIRVFLYKYQQERGVSNRTLDKVRGTISSFYKWATIEEYIVKDPTLALGKIKYEKKERQPCTQRDMEYLRLACKSKKDKAVIEMLYSTGCRISELARLKKDDVDWQDKTVKLFGKGQKHRTSFLNAKAEVALKEYLDTRVDDGDGLFVSDRRPYKQLQKDGLAKIVRLIAERAHDHVTKPIHPHIFRHTLATRMLENGASLASIQQVLGHDNINTTMIYAHTTLANVKLDHLKAAV